MRSCIRLSRPYRRSPCSCVVPSAANSSSHTSHGVHLPKLNLVCARIQVENRLWSRSLLNSFGDFSKQVRGG